MISLATGYEITLFLYNIALVPIVFFSVLFLILTLINLYVERRPERPRKKLIELPFITVQIPTFNDPIADRCVRKCMEFDYPKDKYEIVIADDSTNVETQLLLQSIATEHPGFVKYIHRDNRVGFKPGALNNALKISKGELLVVFDADWIPARNFLRTIIEPFADRKVALVQTRQGFYNHETNLITRFASYVLMIYHTIVMPINNRINCVFFCGTAGALRRSAFEEVGGWNAGSITEDCEVSVKLLLKGYKSVYLQTETPSEVPDTFEGFVKQQMRWAYGNTRVFLDNAGAIFSSSHASVKQKIMIFFVTMANMAAPFVVLMTIFGLAGWFIGEPRLMSVADIVNLAAKLLFTAGFLVMGYITLRKHRRAKEFGIFVASVMTVGIVLAVANSIAFIKALFNSKLHWHCTPKIANEDSL